MGMLTSAKTLAPAIGGVTASVYPQDAEAGWLKKSTDEILNVWHGGGDFNELDFSNIGSGEGTSAYSRGFYTADKQNTSRNYAEGYSTKNKYEKANLINDFQKKLPEYGYDFSSIGLENKKIIEEVENVMPTDGYLNKNDIIDIARNYRHDVNNSGKFEISPLSEYLDPIYGDTKDYARHIAQKKLKKEYTPQYYLEPQWFPEENYYESPLADSPMKAAEMAKKARLEDGITNEKYNKLKRLKTNEGLKEIESQIEKAKNKMINAISGNPKKAYLYNMEFPGIKKENVMMWDMSISGQPKVKEVFKNISNKIEDFIDKDDEYNYLFFDELTEKIEAFKNIASGKKIKETDLKNIQKYARVSAKEMDGIENINDVGAGVGVWLLESIVGPKKTAELLFDNGIKASSHFDRSTRNKYRTVPFNKRKDNPENTYNHVIYQEVPVSILSKDQVGNADPKLLAAIAGSGGAVSAGSQVEGEDLKQKIKTMFSDYVDNTFGALGSAFDGLEVPQRGLQGLGRAGYGLLTGESLDEALNQGANVVNQGVDNTSKQFGDFIFEKTGSPTAATAGLVGAKFLSPI